MGGRSFSYSCLQLLRVSQLMFLRLYVSSFWPLLSVCLHWIYLASLWLCPPKGSPIEIALIHLITTTIPTYFGDEKVPKFQPHITLTSDIPPGFNAQTVLDSITISDLPEIVFSCFNIGSDFCTPTITAPSAHSTSHDSQRHFLHPWYPIPAAHFLSSGPCYPVPRKVCDGRTI